MLGIIPARFLLYISVFVACFSFPQSVLAEVYYFIGTQNQQFDHQPNWFPSYPGLEIGPNDRVVLTDDVILLDDVWEIFGVLEVRKGARFWGPECMVQVHPGGVVDIDGEMRFQELVNFGSWFIRKGAKTKVERFYTAPLAVTIVMSEAMLVSKANLQNEGQFDNYGQCKVGKDFVNEGNFKLLKYSKLEVQGLMRLGDTSQLSRSSSSILKCSRHQRKLQPIPE
ncbi:hypothetical protein [Pontibacter sp. G13]|uniref:hypothetical protein n=1 Tax=Pontibacter sp. G13 TaxID=3074898 RepID=UPI00288AD6DB|nr:hypothetical protein [Pontibacter sp. G13]WNJ20832.1 hypothetical protein RJD25_10140 [Pontibacter sp. G13]